MLLAIPAWGQLSRPPTLQGPAEALRAYVNAQRTLKCPTLPLFTGTAILTHAVDTFSSIDIEVSLSVDSAQVTSETYRASMLGGEILPATTLPSPCDGASHLIVTYQQINAVNAQNLPWKSAMPPHMLKRVYREETPHRGLNRRLLQAETVTASEQPQTMETASEQPQTTTPPPLPPIIVLKGVALPRDYDARDVYPGQASCKGFQVLDQGATGACAFFATVASFSTTPIAVATYPLSGVPPMKVHSSAVV